jgi:hypothetical protein
MKGFAGFGVQTFKGNDKRMQHSDRKSFPQCRVSAASLARKRKDLWWTVTALSAEMS